METTADIVDFAFQPADQTVPVGSTITWTHRGDVAHTVTFRGLGRDSGTMNQGDTFAVTFDQAGTFSYVCIFHGQMQGSVTVTG